MQIKKIKDKIVVEIPFWQTSYDAVGQEVGRIPNIIGLIEKEVCSLNQLIDMSYKGKTPQLGGNLVETSLEPKGFKKLCKELQIDYIELPVCSRCFEAIWGVFTIDEEGKEICLDCDNERKINVGKKNRKV